MTRDDSRRASPIEVRPVGFPGVRALRDAYRREAACQIVRDSILERGLGDAYLLVRDGEVAGYGGVWTQHFPGRVMEFFALEDHRDDLAELFAAFARTTGATHLEAQTNIGIMDGLLDACATDVVEENILFEDGPPTELALVGATVRPRTVGDVAPEGEWILDVGWRAVAAGGVLRHYNPPFGDLFLEVIPEMRGQGLGSFFVQELRRICRAQGLTPAARCDPDNVASRRALARGGLVECGTLRAGVLRDNLGAPTGAGPF
jgi:GNAT superfamily N-acetyltransferase